MSTEDRLRTAADDVASFVSPGPLDLPELRRRARRIQRRRLTGAVVAVAVVVAVVAITAPQLRLGASPDPIDKTPSPSPAPIGAVWYDADGHVFHVGPRTFAGPTDDDVASLGLYWDLVLGGVVYRLPEDTPEDPRAEVFYQTVEGEPVALGTANRPGPVTDPLGSTAAWFDRGDLVVVDTTAGDELARVDLSHLPRPSTRPFDQPIRYVGPDRVIYEQAGQVWELVWDPVVQTTPTGRSAEEFVDGATGTEVLAGDRIVDRIVDRKTGAKSLTRLRILSEGRVTATYGPVIRGEGDLSPDGRYLATWKGYQDDLELVVLDLDTGRPVPQLAGHHLVPFSVILMQGLPWVWSYDNTLVTVERAGPHGYAIIACTVSSGACQMLSRSVP